MTERKGRINPLDNKNVRILITISVVKRILMLAFIPKPINTHPAMYKGMFRYSSTEGLLSSPEQLYSFTSFFI